jgi:large-conductance mechanosensitive channel
MGIFLQNMWEEMFGEKLDIIIETDSSAARCVAMRQGIGRIRHLEVRQIYMQQLVKSERLVVKKLPGVDNTADLGTKPVTSATFYHLIELVGLRKFEHDNLEVILPWRTKKIKSGGTGSVAAMMIALVGALQTKEVEAVDDVIKNPLGQYMMTKHYEINEAAQIIDSAANNFFVVGLCILALVGAIAIGVILTLAFQTCNKVVHEFNREQEQSSSSSKPDVGPAVPITVALQEESEDEVPVYTTGKPTNSRVSVRLDPRLRGGYVSGGGTCIHASESCIIRHSCYGEKAARQYKTWCSKCTPMIVDC